MGTQTDKVLRKSEPSLAQSFKSRRLQKGYKKKGASGPSRTFLWLVETPVIRRALAINRRCMVTWQGSVAVVRHGVLWCVMAACQHIRILDFDGSFRRKDKAVCKQMNSRNTQEHYANWVCFLF